MKRYMPTHSCRMKENEENGSYVRYDMVRDLIEYILNDCSLWETKPELLIKEWGE